jgi:DNA replication protein DnaC
MASKGNVPYSKFLFSHLELEITEKQERMKKTLLKFAKFHYRKTMDQFDFTAQPDIDERRIGELINLSLLDAKENLIFLGSPGIRKTHLAVAIGMKTISRGLKTYFITLSDLVSQLKKAEQQDKLEKKIRVFVKPLVLIIDEIGFLNLDPKSAHYLFQVISRRYGRGSIILTSNKGFGE